jgi:hypothetical protein
MTGIFCFFYLPFMTPLQHYLRVSRERVLARLLGYQLSRRYTSTITSMEGELVQGVDGEIIQEDTDVQEDIQEDQPKLRGSIEANFGRKRIGGVTLPLTLQEAVAKLLVNADKKMIKYDTMRMFDALRTTAGPAPTETSVGKSRKYKR